MQAALLTECVWLQKELFDTVLQHMAHLDEDTAAAATEVVVFLMGEPAVSAS